METFTRLRVLVVDDSKLMRRLIRDILTSDPALEVVGEAPEECHKGNVLKLVEFRR